MRYIMASFVCALRPCRLGQRSSSIIAVTSRCTISSFRILSMVWWFQITPAYQLAISSLGRCGISNLISRGYRLLGTLLFLFPPRDGHARSNGFYVVCSCSLCVRHDTFGCETPLQDLKIFLDFVASSSVIILLFKIQLSTYRRRNDLGDISSGMSSSRDTALGHSQINRWF